MARKDRTPDQMMALMELAQRVARIRQHYRLSQRAFAKKMGLSHSHIAEVERQRAKPSVEMLLGIASEYPEVRPGWLLSGEGPMLEVSHEERLGGHLERRLWDELATRLADELDAETRESEGRGLTSSSKLLITTVLPLHLSEAYEDAKRDPKVSHRAAINAAVRKAREYAKEIVSL